MKICLIKAGEPLPTDGDHSRLLRTGMLFEYLSGKHEVTWITESFNHQHKTRRAPGDATFEIADGARIRLLHTLGYSGNISPRRMLDDLNFAWKCWRELSKLRELEVIVCAYPLVMTAFVCVVHAKRRGIPIVIDVRDLWPDIFYLATRRTKKWLGASLAIVLEPFARYTFRNATSVIGITDGIVDWACQKAGRARRPQDLAFALGFLPQPPSSEGKEEAKKFWEAKGIRDDHFVFAYVGQINNKVDMETVVRGFIAAGLPDSARLVIAGAGDDLESMQRLAKGHPGVVFPGWINKFQLEELLRRAKVGLAPYRNRIDFQLSVPNKVIEYLFYGVPIAASIDGEITRIIRAQRCGDIYQENRPDTFAGMAKRLFFDDAFRQQLSKNALAVYDRDFEGGSVFARLTSHLQSYASGLRPSAHST